LRDPSSLVIHIPVLSNAPSLRRCDAPAIEGQLTEGGAGAMLKSFVLRIYVKVQCLNILTVLGGLK
jgi:hypothetical protein